MLSERRRKILNLIVREYSKKREPVGSKEFSQRFFPDLSPATIRREFFTLTKSGFLIQSHASAGRIPTDKAYKLFVDNVLENEEKLVSQSEQWQKKIKDFDDNDKNIFSETAKMAADFCDGLAISYWPDHNFIFKFGLGNLFSHLPDISQSEIGQILDDIEFMDGRMEGLFDELFDMERSVFIGKESPITKSENLSVISRSLPAKEKSLILLIGPKNMSYDKNLAILEAIANFVHNP